MMVLPVWLVPSLIVAGSLLALVFLTVRLWQAGASVTRYRRRVQDELDESNRQRKRAEAAEAKTLAVADRAGGKLREQAEGHETRYRQLSLKYAAMMDRLAAAPGPELTEEFTFYRAGAQERIAFLERALDLATREIAGRAQEAAAWQRKAERLAEAVRAHRDARGHDRCQENTTRLYVALDEPFDPKEVFRLPDLPEWLTGCTRYWLEERTRQYPDEGSYKELVERLKGDPPVCPARHPHDVLPVVCARQDVCTGQAVDSEGNVVK